MSEQMDKTRIANTIQEYIVRNSGFEPTRNYLSISHVTGCPRRAVREYRDGFSVDGNTHRMRFAGYEQERSVREILNFGGIITQVGIEVVAPFDNRLRGHVDGVSGNDLIEIKSVSTRKWEKLQSTHQAIYEHFAHCQLYMLYGGFKQTFVIYRNRETYEHEVVNFQFSEQVARGLELKAKVILDAIDGGELPKCTCGRCK